MVRNFKQEVDEKDLKPCPHCGSEARTWKQGIVKFQLVKCSNDSCGSYFTKYTPHEWNRRKSEEALEKHIKELENKNYMCITEIEAWGGKCESLEKQNAALREALENIKRCKNYGAQHYFTSEMIIDMCVKKSEQALSECDAGLKGGE